VQISCTDFHPCWAINGEGWIKITSEKVGWTGHKWGRSANHTPSMERPEKKETSRKTWA